MQSEEDRRAFAKEQRVCADRVVKVAHARHCTQGEQCQYAWCSKLRENVVHMDSCTAGAKCTDTECVKNKECARHFAECTDRESCLKCSLVLPRVTLDAHGRGLHGFKGLELPSTSEWTPWYPYATHIFTQADRSMQLFGANGVVRIEHDRDLASSGFRTLNGKELIHINTSKMPNPDYVKPLPWTVRVLTKPLPGDGMHRSEQQTLTTFRFRIVRIEMILGGEGQRAFVLFSQPRTTPHTPTGLDTRKLFSDGKALFFPPKLGGSNFASQRRTFKKFQLFASDSSQRLIADLTPYLPQQERKSSTTKQSGARKTKKNPALDAPRLARGPIVHPPSSHFIDEDNALIAPAPGPNISDKERKLRAFGNLVSDGFPVKAERIGGGKIRYHFPSPQDHNPPVTEVSVPMVASYAHDYVGTRNRSHATKTVDIDISLPQKLPTSLQKGFVPNAMLPGSLKSLEADRAAEEAEKQKYEEAARKRDAELQALKEEAQVAQDNSQKRWKEALEKSTETRRKLTTTLKALATNTPFDQLGGLLGSCLSRPLPAWKRVPSGLGFRGLRGHDGNAIPITGGIKDLAGAWFRPTNSCLTKAKPSLAFLRSKGAGSSDEHQTSQLELEPSPQVPRTGLGTDAVRQLARLQQQLRVCLVTSNSDVVQSHSVPAVDERRVALLPPRYYGSVPTHHKLFERRELSYDEEEQREAVREEHQQKIKNFVSAACTHAKAFFRKRENRRQAHRRVARDVRKLFDTVRKMKGKEEERQERARLKLLRENDMEAYQKLLHGARNERLQYLVSQTDAYLASLTELVKAQKRDIKRAKKLKRKTVPSVRKGKGAASKEGIIDDDSGDAAGEDGDAEVAEDEDDELNEEDIEVKAGESLYNMLAHQRQELNVRQPSILVGGTLKTYQMAGLAWLVSLYNNNLNGILADEMGLGKTIQTIALLTYLVEFKRNGGPFLVVVPLSTLSNWTRELDKWAPSLTRVVYKGSPSVRKDIFRNEMSSGQYNVLLTTYEYVMRDKAVLRRTRWEYIIVDEGHRMKNSNCKFSQILGQAFEANHRVLLTGTPLQNDLIEMWSLLNFLLPKVFSSKSSFEQWFSQPFQAFQSSTQADVKKDSDATLSEEERLLVINRLHQILRPFLLRRVKNDVLHQLPTKVEKVIKCPLSAWQRLEYHKISEHGMASIRPDENGRQISGSGLRNILMQLRKISNHPYLFLDQWDFDERLIRCSGKLALLDRLLTKMRRGGHRVLIFSQMTQLMDVLEDYFRYRQFRYLRLDGSTKQSDREEAMYKFNAPDSPYFLFLLSTRAGGLGVNLATADTVVIFDSDWNPQMDLQAQDRAHRIGQQHEVRVFRLIANAPVEERMLSRANDKLSMENLIIAAGNFNNSEKSNAKTRRSALINFLKQVQLEQQEEENSESGLPTAEEINEMLARHDGEKELFDRIDMEEDARLRKAGFVSAAQEGKPATAQAVMQIDEVPDFVKAESVPASTEDAWGIIDDGNGNESENGRSKRKRNHVTYAEILTDREYTRLLDKGATSEEIEEARQRKIERLRKRQEQSANKTHDDVAQKRLRLKLEGSDSDAASGTNNGRGRRTPRLALKRRLSGSPNSNGGLDADAEQDVATQPVSSSGRPVRKRMSFAVQKQPEKASTRKKRPTLYTAKYTRPSAEELSAERAALNSRIQNSLEAIMKLPDDWEGAAEGSLSVLFREQPSRRKYPDYFKMIVNPIALRDMLKAAKRNGYARREQIASDFALMVANAEQYNQPDSLVVQQAYRLKSEFDARMDSEE